MNKKKLFILAGPLDNQRAGVHRATYEMINAFHNSCPKDFEIVLIREKKSDDFSKFKSIIIPTIKCVPGFQSFRLLFIIPLVCLFGRANYVLETAHLGPFNLPPWIKRITIIHDLTPILFPEFHTFFGAFLQKVFLPGIIKNSDLIVANSNNTKNDIESVYPFKNKNIKRIYFGISKIFKRQINPRVPYKYDINYPFFMCASTLEPRKNIDTLLRAFDAFCLASPSKYNLVLVGEKGWKNKKVFENIKNHSFRSQIVLTGYVTDEELNVLYSMCTALIYPSIYEGFGFPVLEAQACGAHCIVANNSSLKEISHQNTALFETMNANDLANKMLATTNNISRPKISIRNEFYTWENFALQFFEEVNSI